jgi:hypothetical protein
MATVGQAPCRPRYEAPGLATFATGSTVRRCPEYEAPERADARPMKERRSGYEAPELAWPPSGLPTYCPALRYEAPELASAPLGISMELEHRPHRCGPIVAWWSCCDLGYDASEPV